jgi:hypothetical protein
MIGMIRLATRCPGGPGAPQRHGLPALGIPFFDSTRPRRSPGTESATRVEGGPRGTALEMRSILGDALAAEDLRLGSITAAREIPRTRQELSRKLPTLGLQYWHDSE